MSRSVSYLNNAEYVLYFPFEYEVEENGESNPDIDNMNWEDLVSNLTYEIKARLPSYYIVNKWDNRETKIILQNNLCIIGISEYCGLVSLSVATREYDGYEQYPLALAQHHASQIRGTLEKIIDNLGLKRLYKQGTFSNGEAVFQLAK